VSGNLIGCLWMAHAATPLKDSGLPGLLQQTWAWSCLQDAWLSRGLTRPSNGHRSPSRSLFFFAVTANVTFFEWLAKATSKQQGLRGKKEDFHFQGLERLLLHLVSKGVSHRLPSLAPFLSPQ
jgi:hypothetical protein